MKILVVRFKQIGDSILASPMCNTLKKTFPDAEIDYVLYEHVSPIFKNHKYIDNVISITKEEQKNPFKYIAKVWKVTRKKYDIVIDIMSTPKSEMFTLFSLGAKYRIGRKKKHRGYTYTHKIEEPRDAKDKVDKFLKMLKPLEKEYKLVYDNNYIITITPEEKKYMREKMEKAGIDFTKPVIACAINSRVPAKVYPYDNNYIITITPEEKKYMREKMEKAGIDFTKPVIACAINSRVPAKVYPVENMVQAIKKLLNDLDIQIIFYYSPDEKQFAKNVHENMLGNDKRIFSNVETSSIRELGMLLSNCNMFFGNEGGPRHLAQSLDIPSFAIFSPGSSKKEWLSNANDRHQGVEPQDIQKNFDRMTRDEIYRLITPEYIVSKVEEMFEKYVK